MKYWVDLHIHSCLSPCAEDDMTPNNIVNMALIKGLDIIAVTDHNSVRNVRAVMEAGERSGLLVVPGMELCTSEEIHLVCLFLDYEKALSFESLVYENLPSVDNREDIFGAQIIMDSEDNETGRETRFLAGACGLDIETSINLARGFGGIVIPAHINRQSYSILATLGSIPPDYNFKYLEYSKHRGTVPLCAQIRDFIQVNPELGSYNYITSSDAHFLGDILEQEVALDLPDKSIQSLLHEFRGRRL